MVKNIRTLYVDKYELFNQMTRERGVLQWQIRKQEH